MMFMSSKLALIMLSMTVFAQPKQHQDVEYHPLALGKIWTYDVKRIEHTEEHSKVSWRVTKQETSGSSVIYQVWPEPMQADDEAMRLRVTEAGIEEIDSKVYLLKFPLAAGTTWSTKSSDGNVRRSFRVLSIGSPCGAATKQFQQCAVVEDDDPQTGLRTVTTYARNAGSVKFEYFRKTGGVERCVQTLELETPPQ
jgi:hypothetical protein